MLTNPPLVLDTDILSCFAWIKRMDILEALYSGHMLVPEQVLVELSKVSHLRDQVDLSIANNHIVAVQLDPLKPEAQEFAKLLSGDPPIGRGEAAVMAFVKFNGGTISSNNLTDVLSYSVFHELPLISIRAMFYDAIVHRGVLTEEEGEQAWNKMKGKRRQLPCPTVKDIIEYYSIGFGISLELQRY